MFYITISNGLLDGDHQERMGNSVWLFMWFIDKITKIDDEGWGWVLGGKPINLKDIEHLSRRSAQRYLTTLQKEEYIKVTRTMRGFIVKVAKAKKRFQGAPKVAHHIKSDIPKVAHHDTKSGASLSKSGASNKTVSVDRTVDNITRSPFGASREKPMYDETYNLEPDESVTPSRKYQKREAIKEGYKGHEVKPIRIWAEARIGQKFPNPLKQESAIKKMLYAGYSTEKIKECWDDLEDDKFWSEKGIDFGVVLSQIAKRKPKTLNPLLYGTNKTN